MKLLFAIAALAVTTLLDAAGSSVADAVSIGEIDKTLHAIDYDRTSGRDGEKRAAALLEAKLTEYGVEHRRHDMRAYLSWPAEASLTIGGKTLRAVTPSFGASTPPGGLEAPVVFLPDSPEDDTTPIAQDVRGKIVAKTGLIAPENVWRAQLAGAAAVVHVNVNDVLHEMTATTVWGTPTPGSASRIPTVPVVSITKSDGMVLREAVDRGAKARIVAAVERGWTEIPLVVAEVPGRTPDFILVATHLDAWYSGMTDTGGTVASILEMARVLQKNQATLERGVRFAWWPGHSFGRYAGSTWFVDRFWRELDRHCVAYTNLDGSGRRGSQTDAVEAGGWPGIAEYARGYALQLTGKSVPEPKGLFRPGRDSDSAFQGLGIPHFFVGVPGPPDGHPDVEPAGLITYWHTAQDTYDKLDLKALELDTRYRLAQIHDLATAKLLPLKVTPIAAAFDAAVKDLAAAGTEFDFSTVRGAVKHLAGAAERLEKAPAPNSPQQIAARNRLLVRVTHRLNSALYTKAGRYDQDPAAALPILPVLAGVRRLATLERGSDSYGFLETELIRGRNEVEAALDEAADDIERSLEPHR